MSKTDIELWESPVECDLNPPWGEVPIPDWVMNDFPSCIDEYTYPDPTIHTRVSVEPPDLNWYDCFCLTFTKAPGSGQFAMLSCGSTSGVCTGPSGTILLDGSKSWKDNSLIGTLIINNTQGYSGVVVTNDTNSLRSTADGLNTSPYQQWNTNDSYEMSTPGSLTFSMDKSEGTDCCAQSYEYSFDFTMPCLPHNLTAATKLWYRYVVNCTKYHTADDGSGQPEGTQYTQQECEDIWEASYQSLCSQDTAKFTEPGRFTDQSAVQVGIGDAVTIVKPRSYSLSKLFHRFAGSIAFSDVKPVTSFSLGTTGILPTASFDLAGETGYPKPVPFEISKVYPEPNSIISAPTLDVLITVRFNTVGAANPPAGFIVNAYFSDTPETILTPTIVPVDSAYPAGDTLSHYRFWSLHIENGDGTPVIANGQNRTLVLLAHMDKGNGKIYSSKVEALYSCEVPATIVFETVEFASGSVFSCELNCNADSVELVDSGGTASPCSRVAYTDRWYKIGSSSLPAYFRAYKDGSVYTSDTITSAGGTSNGPSIPLQQTPDGSSNVVRGEFVQVMGYSAELTSVLFGRAGDGFVGSSPHVAYTDALQKYKIFVFVSDDPAVVARNKFFNVVCGPVTLGSPGQLTVSSISDPATSNGYFNERVIELKDGTESLGQYFITSSTYSAGWTFYVASVSTWSAWGLTTVTGIIEPARSFPMAVSKTFHGITTQDQLTLAYDPAAPSPAQSYVNFESDPANLYCLYPPTDGVVVVPSSLKVKTNNPVTELVLMCPEASEAFLSSITAAEAESNLFSLQALPSGMDQVFAGIYTSKVETPYIDGAYEYSYYLLNIGIGSSFTLSQRLTISKETSNHPYGDSSAAIDLQYPVKVGSDYMSRTKSLAVSRLTYGTASTQLMYRSLAEINLNGQDLPIHLTTPPATRPYVLINGSNIDLYIRPTLAESVLLTWSDPLAGVNKYAGKILRFLVNGIWYSANIASNTACEFTSDPYLRITISASISPSFPSGSNVSSFMIISPDLVSLQDTHAPVGDGKLYQRRLYTLKGEPGEGPQPMDVSANSRLTFIWYNPWLDIPWLGNQSLMRDIQPAVRTDGFKITGLTVGTDDHRDQIGIDLDLQVDYPYNLAANAWQYKTLTITRVSPIEAFEEIGTYQILSHDAHTAGSATPLKLWLNTASLNLAITGANVCVGVVGIANAFNQYSMTLCGAMPPDGSGASITYRVIKSSGIPWGSSDNYIVFTLDSKSYPIKVLGNGWSNASLEISADIVGADADGIQVSYDNRWSLPMLKNLDLSWPLFMTWALPGECEEFYISREQTTQALADEAASYVDCGAECEFDITLDGKSFKCDFGFKVIGRSVNIAGCGGGGLFHDMYISCPWSHHVHCDRPTAPCNCVFVLSYLLVIPLGSVLL